MLVLHFWLIFVGDGLFNFLFIYIYICLSRTSFLDIFLKIFGIMGMWTRTFYILMGVDDLPWLSVLFMNHRVQTFAFFRFRVNGWGHFVGLLKVIELEHFINSMVTFVPDFVVSNFFRRVGKKQNPETNSHIFLAYFFGVNVVCMDKNSLN